MRSAARKLSGEEALYSAALRALARRAHSSFEMRTYLETRSQEPQPARRVLARLKQEKLIDDARYALDFARRHALSRRQGPHRIARELRRRGVPDRHIEAAVDQIFAELDQATLLRKVIERRMRHATGLLDPRRLASLYRTLLRAGFDSGLIRRELRAAQPGGAARDLETSEASLPGDP
jgi:regulatory protein